MTMRNFFGRGLTVNTPDGYGRVIKDCRLAEVDPYPLVWVRLHSGDNPQSYRPEELS